MKRIISLAIGFMAFAYSTMSAQDAPKGLINTIKDRLDIAAYAHVGSESDFIEVPNESTIEKHSFLVRRIELNLKAQITDQLMFSYLGDFTKGHFMKDFYVDYTVVPEFGVQVGQFKTAFGMENNIAPYTNEVTTAGSKITRYLAACDPSDALFGAQGGRDIGVQVHGDLFNRILSYRMSLLNGQGINTLDFNNAKTFDASLIVRPLSNLAIMASTIHGKSVARNSFILDLIKEGEEYNRSRWALGVNFKSKYANFHTEYMMGKDGFVSTDGFYFTGSWHLLPKFDVYASYDFFRQNYELEKVETKLYNVDNYTVGLQYWFYPKCRIQVQYSYADVNSVNIDPIVLGSMQSKHNIATQLQIAF